ARRASREPLGGARQQGRGTMLAILAQRATIGLACLLALIAGSAPLSHAGARPHASVAGQVEPLPFHLGPGWVPLGPVPPPPPAGVGPVRLDRVTVDATVIDGIATTRVTQEVRNPTERPQEAIYLFPLPVDAAVSDFALWVDGERWDAE